jgi:hypothetical protein
MYCKIKNIKNFESCRKNNNKFIIIDDVSNPMKIHKVSCSFIKQKYFKEKVIKNKNRNGYYCCFDSLNESIEYALNELNKKESDIEDLKCSKCFGSD